ncbi:glycosyltransferase family 2 protein [Candidatus Woesearchaeota archaeon]|nr:glycosyltransferase family 2 protein [Candidatus Woesearchaeota archaeon]
MKNITLSGLILTHNNSRTIKQCINSIKSIVDELVIIDDYSTDDTLKIIKKLYPKFKVHKRKLNNNFAAQRNFALTKVENDWVLFIDSDEVISQALKKEIMKVLKNPTFDAYTSRRDNQAFDFFIKSTSGRPILLKKHLKFKGRVHENVENIKFGYLKNSLLHLSWIDAKDWINDLNRYSFYYANKWYKEKRKYNRFHLFLIGGVLPFFWFFKLYLYDGRWRGKIPAMLYCLAWSIQWTFTALKFYELKYINNKS